MIALLATMPALLGAALAIVMLRRAEQTARPLRHAKLIKRASRVMLFDAHGRYIGQLKRKRR